MIPLPRHADAPPVLRVEGLDIAYGTAPVLHGIDLRIGAGEAHCLLGRNGAGKTTLVRAILGRIRPRAGTVTVEKGRVALVPQDIALFPKLTVRENLAAFARLSGLPRGVIGARVAETMAQAGIAERRDERVETLSGGWQRRVNIAAAILDTPRLLVLDEPTVGVDAAARAGLHALIDDLRAGGMGILVVTHDLDEAATLCGHAILLDAGRVVRAGPIADLMEGAFRHDLRLSIAFVDPAEMPRAAALTGLEIAGEGLTGMVADAAGGLHLVESLTAAGIAVRAVSLERPALAHLHDALTAGSAP